MHLFCTDGVLMDPGHAPTGAQGSRLGDWSYEGTGPAIIVGTGVYATDLDGEGWHTKFRGFQRCGDLVGLLAAHKTKRYIPLAPLVAKTLRQLAGSRNARWADLNDLKETPRVLDIRFDYKRTWIAHPRAGHLLRSWERSTARAFYGRLPNELKIPHEARKAMR